jgi:hypothetical protein
MNRPTVGNTRVHARRVFLTLLSLISVMAAAQGPPAAIPTASSAMATPASTETTSAPTQQTAPVVTPTGTPTQAWQPNVRKTAKPMGTPDVPSPASPVPSPRPTATPPAALSTAPLPSPVPEGLPVEKRRQLLYFRIPESRDCAKFEGTILTDPAVKTAMAMLSMEQINMDSGDPRITRMRIMRAPSFIVMRPDGTEIARHVGAITAEEFLALLTK